MKNFLTPLTKDSGELRPNGREQVRKHSVGSSSIVTVKLADLSLSSLLSSLMHIGPGDKSVKVRRTLLERSPIFKL